ncbi:hypothetical protein [Rhizobium leguminosarum]
MNRGQLSTVTLMTVFDLLEEYEATVHIARFADLPTVDAVAVSEAIEWVSNKHVHARYGVEADTDFVGLRLDRLVSIMIGGDV